ncbi:MAG: DUF4417 domain-containing protein [Clostridia bacterium]
MQKQELELQNDLKTENDNQKQERKQRIIRNEFITVGKYGIPLIKRQEINLNKIKLWGYKKTKEDDMENSYRTIHFFTQDWLFESVYQKPEIALEKLDQYYAVLTPDFSLYIDMPLALQLYSIFKSRWCGAFWQKNGLRVIPTVNWGTPESFEFCFDGIEQGSTVAVSTYYMEDYEKEFMPGYNKMLEVIQPSAIICYGDPFDRMKGNIKAIDPYNRAELMKTLGITEYTRKLINGELYPAI